MTTQIKSKQRVARYGEVFTAEREVKAICDLVKAETERIDSRFLEPACGDGNFLHEILSRKLAVVKRKYEQNIYEYERNALLALSGIYGVDILFDNIVVCRKRLFTVWDEAYVHIYKEACHDACREKALFILSRNIICGNMLSLMLVDEHGEDTDKTIVFSEWSFDTDNQPQYKEHTIKELLQSS